MKARFLAVPPHATSTRGDLRLREDMSRHVSWRAGGVAERAYLRRSE